MSNKQPKRFLVGYFNVPNHGPDSVETEVVGSPQEQYAKLAELIRQRHPKAPKGGIERVGSVVELRDGSDDFIELPPGATIGQIFDTEGNEAEATRTVGSAFVEATPCKIVLILSRDAQVVRVQLTPVLKNIGNGITRFSNQINPQQSATELPQILKDVLGSSARDMKLRFRTPIKK